ncbi:hypothetical protein CLI64_22835 [Nostoc sp. CENA543]|uniref:hypothetical protein n=1 Tax=Nostoc sp. CENA543 TaxID=1869241 RepID=UPI000CA1D5F5|nr:hypothetical protein [Nostoc sp. CENA543]AUT03013.1 hypothetical protein CLI64_22835 [Nostoc sp. CENA543]
MNNLGRKRVETVLAIASYAIGSATASVTPTPGGEIPKQVILTSADILMYTTIWKIYFAQDLSNKELIQILTDLGIVTLTATGTAYLVSKVTTAMLKEITNWIGPLGWGVTAAIAGSISGLFGATWALYCDYLYVQKKQTI